jgi:hypothetical protein
MPIDDLGRGLYEGVQGGLYPQGQNMAPGRHWFAGLQAAGSVAPLDAEGHLAPESGRIGLLTLGTGNARRISEQLRLLVAQDAEMDPAVTVVNGATGTSVSLMANAGDASWDLLPQQLAFAGVTAAQVQVLWLDLGWAPAAQAFPQNARTLQDELAAIAEIAAETLPNLRLMYLSSGSNAGFGGGRGTLDSYEAGFAVKWLIEDQIAGHGPEGAPWLAWGPYLWSSARAPGSDGRLALREDFASDGALLSLQGARAAAGRLQQFLHTEASAATWFLASPGAACEHQALASTFGHERVGEGAPLIAASTLPTVPSIEPLVIAVSGAPASAAGFFVAALDPHGLALPASGPLLLSFDFARVLPAMSDAAGRASLKIGRVPGLHDALCEQSLCVQFLGAGPGGLVASPGLRLQGGH